VTGHHFREEAALVTPQAEQTIAIIDFGSQYSQLIARRVRECGVFCRIFRHDVDVSELRELGPAGVILSGGPSSVYSAGAPALQEGILALGVPVLGICYGMQVIAQHLGGRVQSAERGEFGPADLAINQPPHPLFAGLPPRLKVWMSHGDSVQTMPAGFKCLATTQSAPLAACADDKRRIYGLQFHPEVAHTEHGGDILGNWLLRICQCKGTWQPAVFITRAVEDIQNRVGSQQAICALSGGVDSTVAATLVKKAIGGRLTCVFVDHGLLRQGEAERCLTLFDKIGLRVVHVDASARFLQALRDVQEPEEKRRIIGREFVRVFEQEARRLGIESGQGNEETYPFLVQGTLYPDVIESSAADTQAAARIKTHHNVGGLPPDMKLRLIEPLRYLFKDEVRRIGVELGLPEEAVYRQPFPGPGLAVRVIGPVTRERLDVLRSADAVVTEEISAAGLAREVWQYFAVLTPVRSVGVMGDYRSYANVVAVRAVVSTDGMTADWARLPVQVLERISSRIVNEVPGVNRVVYDITSKPPSTVEWE